MKDSQWSDSAAVHSISTMLVCQGRRHSIKEGAWRAVMKPLELKISDATIEDLDLLVAHRLEMWREIHPKLEAEVQESAEATREWIRSRLSEGRLVGFVVRDEHWKVAGSGCVWIRDEQPRPTNPRQLNPYLMSMYTEKEFRRKGVAKIIVRRAIEWCRERGYEKIVLHYSKEGRPLYESFGFEPTNEMRLRLWSGHTVQKLTDALGPRYGQTQG